jgi:FAD binding domain
MKEFLPGGSCPAGRRHRFASYYPVGRMEIATALYEDRLEVTPGVVHIVNSCQLCNICDRQCYFLNQLRPLRVMSALDDYVREYLAAGLPVAAAAPDPLRDELAGIVGTRWASSDPAVLASYAQVRSPTQAPQVPRVVVLPDSAEQVAQIVLAAKRHDLPVLPRGNGTSVAGALTDGILLDCGRLRGIQLDESTWSARIGAGVTALELQRQAHRHGLRAHTAEPAACVAANVISTNLHSLFSHSYGMGADNVLDAQFVTPDGEVIGLDDPRATQSLMFHDSPPAGAPGICTSITVRLHPVPDDESVLVVPFADHDRAVAAARTLCARRIGAAVGMVGSGYTASFLSATIQDAQLAERILREDLGIEYVLVVIGDRFALDAVRAMSDAVIDAETMRLLIPGLHNLRADGGLDLLAEVGTDAAPFIELLQPAMLPILRMALAGAGPAATDSIDPDLRDYFKRLYARPEMTDLRWLTTFRIISARIGRGRSFVSRIVWTPMDAELIAALAADLGRVGDRHGLPNGFGYLVPVDLGRRSIMEFDYYYDQADPAETAAIGRVLVESDAVLAEHRARHPQIVTGQDLAGQGLSRPESYLYRT